ncbi:GRAM domain-containing protein 2B-like [Brachionichthys hirsutus]|uniref:GRAM domain-containing protein 2B-like n=1 Tax=Brachionichthys hirsutus TaxID=412623 RepID=UPI00360494BB
MWTDARLKYKSHHGSTECELEYFSGGVMSVKSRSLSLDSALKERVAKDNHEHSDGLVHSFKKQNKTFHKLFQEIPEEEQLTHAFTCALQKEVLYYGKLFVSEFHLCFHSSVLLKDTKVVIPTSRVRQVKKQASGLSVLSVHTADGEKYSFVSLRNRHVCYKLLRTICSHAQENGSPRLSSAENDAEDAASSYSSVEECCGGLGPDRHDDVPHSTSEGASGFADEGGAGERRRHPHAATPEARAAPSWVGTMAARVTPFFVVGRKKDLSLLFYFYVVLMLLLLLLSGYIGLRISDLEEQLKALGELTEESLPHGV